MASYLCLKLIQTYGYRVTGENALSCRKRNRTIASIQMIPDVLTSTCKILGNPVTGPFDMPESKSQSGSRRLPNRLPDENCSVTGRTIPVNVRRLIASHRAALGCYRTGYRNPARSLLPGHPDRSLRSSRRSLTGLPERMRPSAFRTACIWPV